MDQVLSLVHLATLGSYLSSLTLEMTHLAL